MYEYLYDKFIRKKKFIMVKKNNGSKPDSKIHFVFLFYFNFFMNTREQHWVIIRIL